MEHSSQFSTGTFGSTFQAKPIAAAPPIPAAIAPPPPPPSDMFSPPPPSFSVKPPEAVPKKEEHEQKQEMMKEEPTYGDEESYLDWSAFKCLLCRRAFNDVAGLRKHKDKSKLHKENLHNRFSFTCIVLRVI